MGLGWKWKRFGGSHRIQPPTPQHPTMYISPRCSANYHLTWFQLSMGNGPVALTRHDAFPCTWQRRPSLPCATSLLKMSNLSRGSFHRGLGNYTNCEVFAEESSCQSLVTLHVCFHNQHMRLGFFNPLGRKACGYSVGGARSVRAYRGSYRSIHNLNATDVLRAGTLWNVRNMARLNAPWAPRGVLTRTPSLAQVRPQTPIRCPL